MYVCTDTLTENLMPRYYAYRLIFNPDSAEPVYVLSANSVDNEANWSGSALFVIKYVNLCQQSGSNNLIGWKLEESLAFFFYLFSMARLMQMKSFYFSEFLLL